MSERSEEIRENRDEIYYRDNYCCQYHNCPVMGASRIELAHRIAKTEANRDYIRRRIDLWLCQSLKAADIDKIIHHRFNLVTSCRAHNDYFNIQGHRKQMDALLFQIIKDLQDTGRLFTRQSIDGIPGSGCDGKANT